LDALAALGARKGSVPLGFQQIDDGGEESSDDDHEQLKPVEEGDADQGGLLKVIERGPEQDEKGNEQEEAEPGSPLALGMSNHHVSPFDLAEIAAGPQKQRTRCSIVVFFGMLQTQVTAAYGPSLVRQPRQRFSANFRVFKGSQRIPLKMNLVIAYSHRTKIFSGNCSRNPCNRKL
jgi:hypothetical protein